MAEVCPAILASNEDQYRRQMELIAHFAERIHIDLTDGTFAKAITPKPTEAWWPVGIKADFHIMYKDPMPAVKQIIGHKPHLIIIHAESEGDFAGLADFCHEHNVKVGVALLPKTAAGAITPALHLIDHVLIFSGHLGHYGGHAHPELLKKATQLKSVKPELEIGWDGGVDTGNASELILGGVDVLNAGAFILENENPEKAYHHLARIADETGTT